MAAASDNDGPFVANWSKDQDIMPEGHHGPRSTAEENAAKPCEQQGVTAGLGEVDDRNAIRLSHPVHMQLRPQEEAKAWPQSVAELLRVADVVGRIARGLAPVTVSDPRRHVAEDNHGGSFAAHPRTSIDPATSWFDIMDPARRVTGIALTHIHRHVVRTQMLKGTEHATARMSGHPLGVLQELVVYQRWTIVFVVNNMNIHRGLAG